MIGFVAVVMAVLACAALLLTARPRPRGPEQGGSQASFRVGPLWTWCPAEEALTPHLADWGTRRCLSCKTTTVPTSEEDRHA